MSSTPIAADEIEREIEMNAYLTHQMALEHQADLLREADHNRLAKLARQGGEVDFGDANPHRPPRLILALGGAAAAILATATAVLAGR
ncbi:MAG: hypothetical protein QOF11_596 [Chloroflexota bacterium]|jgi:hypothetical protein|nr:hypothetical protein [Chloroflexota bacterium]